MQNSPFNLDNGDAYQHWKKSKLQNHPVDLDSLLVQVRDITCLEAGEHQQLIEKINQTNIVVYETDNNSVSEETIKLLGQQVGLNRLDQNPYSSEKAITSLAVQNRPSTQQNFIPYTNKAISWHTDGYYNPLSHMVKSVILHCVQPAVSGGENDLLDHEIAYIWLRDENPDFIRALSQSDVMTIPAHIENDVEKRADQTGPVFSVINQKLHMRYTHRKRSIIWRDEPLVKQALACLQDLFERNSSYILRGKLSAGQGILSHNVLHNRSAFTDDGHPEKNRLVLRARYYDEIS
jgi:hypothetical protein